jgi:hypothetical protein
LPKALIPAIDTYCIRVQAAVVSPTMPTLERRRFCVKNAEHSEFEHLHLRLSAEKVFDHISAIKPDIAS